MIPPQAFAILAPIVGDVLRKHLEDTPTTIGGATAPPGAASQPPTAAPSSSPTVDMLTGAAVDWLSHEKAKASVRPAMMRATGRLSIGSAIMAAAAAALPAIAQMFGKEIDPEAVEFLVNTLLLIAAGGGTAYGYKHTVRSVDKAKGTA